MKTQMNNAPRNCDLALTSARGSHRLLGGPKQNTRMARCPDCCFWPNYAWRAKFFAFYFERDARGGAKVPDGKEDFQCVKTSHCHPE